MTTITKSQRQFECCVPLECDPYHRSLVSIRTILGPERAAMADPGYLLESPARPLESMLPLLPRGEDSMRTRSLQSFEISNLRTVAVGTLATILTATLAACGGSNGTSTTQPPVTAQKTTVQVNIGDAPSDWMLAFSMNISSMSLTGSNGSAAVASTSVPVEMMHLMGTMQPLNMVNAP